MLSLAVADVPVSAEERPALAWWHGDHLTGEWGGGRTGGTSTWA